MKICVNDFFFVSSQKYNWKQILKEQNDKSHHNIGDLDDLKKIKLCYSEVPVPIVKS